jgi:hypothetical protein
MRLLGDGKHGHAERIQTFRCQACHTTRECSTRHALVPFENPLTPDSNSALCAGRRARPFGGLASFRLSTSHYHHLALASWRARSKFPRARFLSSPASICPVGRYFSTRLRSQTHVLWLWLAIDPTTKILPVLHLGPRTHNAAHMLIHSLRQCLAPGCLPLFTSDGLTLSFYALTAHAWSVARGGTEMAELAPVAGGSRADLWSGEEKLPAAQVGSCHAYDAPGNRGRSQGRWASDWASQGG